MPRKGASSHRTKSSKRNTKHKLKDKKVEIKLTGNNNLLMINNKLILYKNEAKGLWNYLRNNKKNKRCEDEERN